MADPDQYPSRLAEKIVVRLPDGMRDRLKTRAEANGRSVNSEVILALQAWLDGRSAGEEPKPLQIILDTSGMPTSWHELHTLIGGILATGKVNPHSVHVVVNTTAIINSQERQEETERLANAIYEASSPPAQARKKPAAKRERG